MKQWCLERLEEDHRQKEIEQEKKKKEEELRNLKELEKYEKTFQGRKKNKDQIFDSQSEDVSMFPKYRLVVTVDIVLVAICLFSINCRKMGNQRCRFCFVPLRCKKLIHNSSGCEPIECVF